MATSNEITTLQQQIVGLEEEKKRLSDRLNSMKNEYLKFTTSYESTFNEVVREIRNLSNNIQTLREEVDRLQAEPIENVVEEVVTQEEESIQNSAEKVQEPVYETHEEAKQNQQETYDAPKTEPVADNTPKAEPFSLKQDKGDTTRPAEKDIFDRISEKMESISDKFDWEKFIGENLISKLGILILLIGVVIGGKYAIDHQLVSPTLRIIIGSLLGLGLQGVAYKLRPQYEKFSAILASGSVAILYFMTFFAYHLYQLIPMPVAFALMTIITAFTIVIAWSYNREIIAIIGLVGAYVIPFILNDGENGSPWVLLSYIAIINIGVLIISVKKYWRILFVSAFLATWGIISLIYRQGNWASNPDTIKMLLFQAITFLTFYVTFLAYKIKKCLFFQHFDILFLLSNSFIFYGLGYNTIYNSESFASHVGLFTLLNAILHAGVCFLLYKRNAVDQALRRLITGLAISFLTIALLVWMTGHWLTIFWILEAAVLFMVARFSKRPFYERMSYPIFVLALISLIIDWGNPHGGHLEILTPLFDAFSSYRAMWDVTAQITPQGHLLSIINTVIFIVITAAVVYVDQHYPSAETEEKYNRWMKLYAQGLTIMSVFVVTTAILVHLEMPWINILWAIEAVALCYYGREKSNSIFEISSYVILVLQIIAIPWVLVELNPYSPDYRANHPLELSFSLKAMWESIVAFIAIITTAVGELFILQKNKLENGVAEQRELHPIIRTMLFFTTIIAVIAHTEWILTTLLLFIVATGCYYWMKTHEKEHIALYTIALSLALISLACDWTGIIDEGKNISTSLTALFGTAAIGAMLFIDKKMPTPVLDLTNKVIRILIVVIPFITLELNLIQILDVQGIDDKVISTSCITLALAYFTIWGFIVLKKRWSDYECFDILSLTISIISFFTFGLVTLYHLPNEFESMTNANLFHYGCIFILIAACWLVLFYYRKHRSKMSDKLNEKEMEAIFNSIIYLSSVLLISYEISYIGTCLGHTEPYGLLLSIFLGIAALFGIYFGLYKEMKYIRIEGIVLTVITVMKLFFYDMARFDTIHKTIAFVSIGLLMLVISFSYQKIAKAKEKERLASQTQAEKEEAEEKSDEQ